MRNLLRLCSVLLGSIGVLLCMLVVVLGCLAAISAARRIDTVASRLDERLAQSDVKLARIEQRVNTASTELAAVRRDAESLIAQNPEPTRIRAEFERLESRLIPALDRVRATADSLEMLSEVLLAAADIASELNRNGKAAAGLRSAADTIDRAGAALLLPQDKIDAVAAAGAAQVSQTFLELSGKAVEGSELLASGLATARREAVAARARTAEFRDRLVFWLYTGALAVTLLAAWGGLGQLCLISRGRS